MFQVLNKVTGGKPRATHRSSGGRRIILKALPTTSKQLVPKILNRRHVQKCLTKRKIEQKHYYDRSAKARKPMHKGDQVRINRGKTWLTVIDRDQAPRSYHVETPDGCI
jgi:hypothetical protein